MFQMRENGERREGRERLVAVAVDRDKSSQRALKWTVENFITRGQTVRLVHVIPRPPFNPNPASSFLLSVGIDDAVAERQLDNQTMDLFLPFRCYCTRRQIQCEAIVLEDPDVAKALIEYVAQRGIQTLLLGATSKIGLSRLFKATDIPASVLKWAPDFCNIYVIAKGKVAALRSATRPVPIIRADGSSARLELQNLNNEAPSVISLSRENDGLFYDELAALENDTSCSSSDGSFLSFYQSLGSSPNQHNVEPCRCPRFSDVGTPSSSLGCAEDTNEEIRRLRTELKQTMDMYHAACREALAAKQKVKELQEWRRREEKRGREAALEATEAAQKFVESEVQKRVEAETKALREAEERERLLHALGHSHMVVKYQSLLHILAVLFLFYFYFSI
ncbi:Adenine nucleotide alpha hydrolases-like superfamily protein, putative [Theobroma cacao]|uniref:RING-type E3 ubiquitin transferase n=1 Tax=Theobroma cacao TaxID=3641 RepID=A0A061GSS4_THECC|nr:Adenine nucleotide alpha hydrolases-like superfamily protein, putative [Theobroma cacao]